MKTKEKIIIIAILLVFPFFSIQAQKKQGRPEPKEIEAPEGFVYEVLQYRKGEHPRAGQMAISYKDDGINNKPVVVFIHGGGWKNGDKDQAAYQVINVAKRGFVGVSISYRLVSEAPFPACIEDVKQAIRFLKSKENAFPIDNERVGVWGYSAGAHLALMIGLSPEEIFKTNAYSNYNSNVKTVMAVSAPTDFVVRLKERGTLNQFSKEQNSKIQFLKEISPITYVNRNQIPVFMLHGTEDPIVNSFHYKNFEAKCIEEGVDNFKLFEFDEAGHMFYFKQQRDVKPIFNEFLESI